MNKQQLSAEDKQVLDHSISKLSEEDQIQIAAAGVFTSEQCEKIKSSLPKMIAVDYGGPDPRKRLYERSDIEKTKSSSFMPGGSVD